MSPSGTENTFRDIPALTDQNMPQSNPSQGDPMVQRPESFAIGSGNKAIYMDKRGIWVADEDPEKAAIWFKSDGNISIKASALTSETAIKMYDNDGNLVIFIGIENV